MLTQLAFLPGRAVAAAIAPAQRLLPAVAGSLAAPQRAGRRRVWRASDRVYVAIRVPQGSEASGVAAEMRRRLAELPGVRWVAVNVPLGAAIVAVDAPGPGDDELVGTVERVESRHGVQGDMPRLPWGEAARRRAATMFAADVVAAPVALATQLIRRAPLPVEVGALLSFVDVQPSVRRLVERAIGEDGAETVLGTATAAAQALSGGTVGVAVDGAARLLRLIEARCSAEAWRRMDSSLTGPEQFDAERVAVDRPAELPAGPVERYVDHVALFAGIAAAGTLAAARGPRRAVDVALAATPKAAVLARDAFAATLAAALARRGSVLTDPSVLRRLDRINVVLIDTDALSTGRLALGDVVPVDGQRDVAELTAIAHTLHSRREVPHHAARYRLTPLDLFEIRADAARQASDLLQRGVVDLLGLTYDDRLVAVAGLVPEPPEASDALAAATRRAELQLVVAPGPGGATLASADRVVPGGERLVATVRNLQAEGKGVLLVSSRRRALAAADCGVGISGSDGVPPWAAHVLVGRDLTSAAWLIEAAGVAPRVSRAGVTLARAATGVGATMALAGRAPRLSARGLLAVNAAAAAAVVIGWWNASEIARRPIVPPVTRTPWHAMDAQTVLGAVGSTVDGLPAGEIARRSRAEPATAPAPSMSRALLAELANPLTPILLGGAALSAAVGALTDAIIVVAVTATSGLVGGLQRWGTDRAVADLLTTSATATRVVRGGEEQIVPATDLVVGDIVSLVSGDVVPADCRILEAVALEVDESSVTGESLPVAKTATPVLARDIAARTCMLYEGTVIAAGQGRGVVVATGIATETGRGLAAARGAAPPSGVETRLAQLTGTTLPIALGSATAVVAAGLVRRRPVRDTLGAGVGLAVASVPEGLPFLVSAAQLAAARRLAALGALVRNPRTIEALGRADVLCFDKTGTLTQGRIALAAVTDGRKRKARLPTLSPELRPVLAAALRATPQPQGGGTHEDVTDCAVTAAAVAAAVTRNVGAAGLRRASTLPFEPSRGYHATLAHTDTGMLVSVKGAPEQIVSRCARDADGTLNERTRRRLLGHAERLAGQGNRVLAVAEGTPHGYSRSLHDDAVTDLTFLGFLALTDPVRTSAAPSVRQLREAGVQIVMITGDHPRTAEAVARELDVLNGQRVVTGAEIDGLDDEALATLLPNVAVVARGTPAHKVRVVQAFQRLGKTVAMTGDGANDAPAIRLADVGIALGGHGTAAARAAADVVVTDDRLETILAALVEGRAMWASVRKALAILLGGNLGEIAFTLAGALLTGSSPLTARQLLLVNLLTDLAPAMSVALRPPPVAAGALLSEGPEASLGAALTDEIVVRAAATAAGASAAWLTARVTGRRARARTVALAALVGTQLGQTLLVGGASPSVVISSIGSAAALVGIVQTPGLSQFFGCTPLGPAGWTIAGCSAVGASTVSLALPPVVRAAHNLLVAAPRITLRPQPGMHQKDVGSGIADLEVAPRRNGSVTREPADQMTNTSGRTTSAATADQA